MNASGSDAEARDWLRLARTDRVGPATFRRLLARFGTAAAAIEALPEMAKKGGGRRLTPAPLEKIEAELAAGEALGARLLRLGEPDYPALLSDIYDPPPALWALGDPSRLQARSVALVGARNASTNGLRLAEWLARGLAEQGVAVISGLARGIDGAAHQGALSVADGVTAAATAGGVDHLYPPEHEALREAIIARGAVVSEMPIGFAPQAKHFPRRNRIVSGLSLGVVVIEAAVKSGSLITARAALDQGRDVMATPGHPLDPRSAGANGLIRDGATLIRSAEDVIEAIAPGLARDWPSHPIAPPGSLFETAPEPPDADLAARIVALLGPEPAPIDALIRDLGAPAGAVSAALLELELAGRVETFPGASVALIVEPS